MQTFLPYPDFAASARVLDRQRLGKQRLEALHLLRILRGVEEGRGWRNHPALRMWRGHENALARYGIAVCTEWRRRGYADTRLPEFLKLVDRRRSFRRPPWLGDPAFHASHRSNLLRKDPLWYGQFGWSERADLPYVWPKGPA
ncbi:MAG TPA: MSMEG_6728 family protein [Candidatus Thermoplasmatota archaeon]|nr:MSMEG_6728 family protein [Candidatus Thermoplasmatota archaeon]